MVRILVLLTTLQLVYGQFRSPSIVQHPSDILVGRDEPATLNCQASGTPKPSIIWYKDGRRIKLASEGGAGRHMVFGSGDLFFLQVLQDSRHDDSGTYWCVARNDAGSVRSNNATLEIAVLEEDFRVVPEHARVAEGDTAMLQCSPPSGSPKPVITWSKDGHKLDPAENRRHRLSPSGDLIITSSRVEDSGSYECIARNAYATRTAPPATLMVLVKPHLISSSGDVTVFSGSSVELVCRVGGDPIPEVFWIRMSPPAAQLPIQRLVQEENGQVLRIRNVSIEDGGVYACTAENPVGFIRSNTTLTVQSKPIISNKPKNSRVGVDGTARFECIVTGSPKPTTYWIHEGSDLMIGLGQTWSDGRISVNPNNTLTIERVKEDDSGVYSCVSVSEAGSSLTRAHLEVQGVSDMPPPLIAIGASNQTLPLGTEAELPCEAKGTPEPKVTWSFNGNHINVDLSSRHQVTPLGTLRISKLKIEDSGIYTCTAHSISGKMHWNAALAVYRATNPNIHFVKIFWDADMPEPPQNVVVLSVNSTQVTLGWSRGRTGSSSIKSYVVQHWSPDLRGEWQEGTTLNPTSFFRTPLASTVTNLQPNTRYIFTVRSKNKDHVSRPSAYTNVVTTTSSNTVNSNEEFGFQNNMQDIRFKLSSLSIRMVSVEALSSSSLRVNWQTLVDSSFVEGIFVRYRSLNSVNLPTAGALGVDTVHFHLRKDQESYRFHNNSTTSIGSHIIHNLRPETQYEVFIVPFYQGVEGLPSASKKKRTLEAPLFAVPTGLHYRPINETTVKISWDPLPAKLNVRMLHGYNVQGFKIDEKKLSIFNATTHDNSVLVNDLSSGNQYEFVVRGITNFGIGPRSEILKFVHDENEGLHSEPDIITPSDANNKYFIVAIACGALLIALALAVIIYFIYRNRQPSKCPQYFSKADGSSNPWCAYSSGWENRSNDDGVSTMRLNDGTTITALNSTKMTHGTFSGFSNVRFGDSVPRSHYSNNGQAQYYMATVDDKREYHPYPIKMTEDLMYEDPEGFKLVPLKGSNNERCPSPQPYATTPLIMRNDDSNYQQSIRSGLFNFTHNAPQSKLYYSDKHSTSSEPTIQFPPPPPPPLVRESASSISGGSVHSKLNPHGSEKKFPHQQSPSVNIKNDRSNYKPTNNNISSVNNIFNKNLSQGNSVKQFKPIKNRAVVGSWLDNAPNFTSFDPGEGEESDDKSLWSEDTNDRDESSNGSMYCSQPDLNWEDVMKSRSENRYRNEFPVDQNHSKHKENEVMNKLLGDELKIEERIDRHQNNYSNIIEDATSGSSSRSNTGSHSDVLSNSQLT